MKINDIRATIEHVIKRVLTDSGRPTRTFKNDDELGEEIGLDSLDLAVMIVELEQELGVDPFRDGEHSVRTFGDVVSLYHRRLTS